MKAYILYKTGLYSLSFGTMGAPLSAPETPRTSHQFGTERFKGLNIMPRGHSLSDALRITSKTSQRLIHYKNCKHIHIFM